MSLSEIGKTLREHLGESAKHVPTRVIPNFVARIGALVNPQLRGIVADLDYKKSLTNQKARRMLGWSPRDPKEAIVAAGESMVRKGLVKA
jgi:nucleoside-diphosphate-sugar epimerase